MPKWLIAALSWGGAALAVLCAAALASIITNLTTLTTTSPAPVLFLWYGLFVGLVHPQNLVRRISGEMG